MERAATKRCLKCKDVKDVQFFSKNRKSPDGLHHWCKKCQSTYYKKWRLKNFKRVQKQQKAWLKANPERNRKNRAIYKEQRRSQLVDAETARRCGLSTKEVQEHRNRHDGRCDICGTDDPGNGRKKMSLDHCHKTGTFRGFLCNTCNRGIGLLKDSAEMVRAALIYLEKPR